MLTDYQMMQIAEAMYSLKWDETDDIVIELGGTVVSGIHQREDANPKWSREFGTRGYNKDSFIVIKNRSRSPVISSIPNEEDTNTCCTKCGDTKCTCTSV